MSDHPHLRTNGLAAAADPPVVTSGSMAELGRELADLASTLKGPLRSLHVRSGDREIRVEWDEASTAVAAGAPEPAAPAAETAGPLLAVRAPLVGTYYAAPAPDAAPFVRPGDTVAKGQTVAIVEAMKMMNPVVAEHPGLVSEVLVSNGSAVEFDQALISLRPQEDG